MSPSFCIPASAGNPFTRFPGALPFGLFAASLLLALTAQAQTAAIPVKADPLDPRASVPAVRYESSLSQYRRPGDDRPTSWRDANDTVTRIGGWRAYARQAQQADPAPSAKPPEGLPAAKPTAPDMPMPMPAGHGGHKTP